MKSGAMLALAIAATAAAALAWNSNDAPSASPTPAAAPQGHADPSDPHAGIPGAPALSPGSGTLPPGHPPIDGAPGDPYADPHGDSHGAMPPGHPPIKGRRDGGPIAVQPLPDGVTVAQIVRDAEALAGKRVKLAAKVVKSTPNVLGRTWLHVQDGSGDASRGDHDLVVTTQDAVQIGDVVELEGMVVRDRDLGSGYRYEVLLDDAIVRPRSAQGGEAPR